MDHGGTSEVACLRLRGLPFSASQQQVTEFFAAAGYTVADCLITRTDCKPNGQAFVLLPKAEAVKAQLELNNRYIGKRFIEIFTSTLADIETARRLCAGDQPKACGGSSSGANTNSNTSSGSQRSKQAGGASNLHIIRLRGLPFSATPADIKGFLAPIELPDGINSIQMVRHPDLRPTGEAYVHLSTETEVMQALNKHKQMMGKRYIEVFPSCLAELQQSMTPPRPMGYQQMDQGYTQGRTASGDLMHVPLLGMQSVPTGNPAAQAEWMQRQQQLMQLQQQMQLQAAAQHKVLANLQQQRQQHQAANLRMHAQLQAHAQALPNVLQQLQLNDIGSGAQDTMSPVQGLTGLGSSQQQHNMLVLNGLSSMHSGNLACSAAGGVSASAAGASMSLSSNVGSGSSFTACYGLPMGMPGTSGGLSNSAAAAAMATCSPSPLDTQYVPFFCSSSSAPMTALMLQEANGLQAGRLQMFSPSGAIVNNPVGANSMQQQAVFGAEVLSSSANAVDSTALGPGCNVGSAGAMAGPAAFCSDPMLQSIGIGSGPLAGFAQNAFLSQGMGRTDMPGSSQEWLS